ncbi:MAG: hypothetical protein JXR76_14030 [Deltaproteobacteria bacterium]|nr:hypothetical protein [Deltaproteobacteria bacterium]
MSEFIPLYNEDDVRFELLFPEELCCNCGKRGMLRVIEQDTRFTRFYGSVGSELILLFYLPFCETCAETATRRPKTFFHRTLQTLLVFAMTATTFLGIGVVWDVRQLVENVMWVSLGITFVLMGRFIISQRPRGNQSSYFQPVRIAFARNDRIGGKVSELKLKITNDAYRNRFCELNRAAIKDGALEVT